MTVGRWRVGNPEAVVRLRSNRVGLMNLEATAPIRRGQVDVTETEVTVDLVLALDQLRTSFLIERAARSLVAQHKAHDLSFMGTGAGGPSPWRVQGDAVCVDVVIDLAVTVTPIGPAHDPMSRVDLLGHAALGRVELPLPGMGALDDLHVTLDSALDLVPLG